MENLGKINKCVVPNKRVGRKIFGSFNKSEGGKILDAFTNEDFLQWAKLLDVI